MIQFYGYDGQPIPGAEYPDNANFDAEGIDLSENCGARGFKPHEKFRKDENTGEVTNNPDFDEQVAKNETNKKVKDRRKKEYPDLRELADALYHKEKGDDEPMANYIAKCDLVKTNNELVV